jgi:hypothetical protein
MFQTNVVEEIKTQFRVPHFFFENRAIYEIMRKNMVEPITTQNTIWRMRIACCIPKVTKTHSEYVILIAFPLQQWLHERASMLRCSTLLVVHITQRRRPIRSYTPAIFRNSSTYGPSPTVCSLNLYSGLSYERGRHCASIHVKQRASTVRRPLCTGIKI